jgi:hypothetical protein
MSTRWIPICFFVLAAGCGGESSDTATASEDEDRGFTSCGGFQECQPGQYCYDDTFGECLSGCLSNENCAFDQTCDKVPGDNVGTCQNEGSGGGAEALDCPNDESSACMHGCELLDFCGALTPAEYAQCEAICAASGDAPEVQSVVTCAENACEDGCAGIETCSVF